MLDDCSSISSLFPHTVGRVDFPIWVMLGLALWLALVNEVLRGDKKKKGLKYAYAVGLA